MLAFDKSLLPPDPSDEPVLDQPRPELPSVDKPLRDQHDAALPPVDEPLRDQHDAALPPVDEPLRDHRGAALPPVDERLLARGVPYEVLDGVLVHVPPAHEFWANLRSELGALLESHAGAELQVATGMLTRTSRTSDFASDVSVYPRTHDLHTDGRQIEQLAFGICTSESLSHAARKAVKLSDRGVRRVFAIDVRRQRVLEWSREQELWQVLDPDSTIEDPALAASLRVGALLEVTKVDEETVRALQTEANAALEAAIAQREAAARAAGVIQGKSHAILTLLTGRGVSLDAAARERVGAEQDQARIDRWIVRAGSCSSISELLAEL